MAEPTPWRDMLRLAFTLGIAPELFWRLSVREWRALIAPAEQALSRSSLAALMQLYPDRTE